MYAASPKRPAAPDDWHSSAKPRSRSTRNAAAAVPGSMPRWSATSRAEVDATRRSSRQSASWAMSWRTTHTCGRNTRSSSRADVQTTTPRPAPGVFAAITSTAYGVDARSGAVSADRAWLPDRTPEWSARLHALASLGLTTRPVLASSSNVHRGTRTDPDRQGPLVYRPCRPTSGTWHKRVGAPPTDAQHPASRRRRCAADEAPQLRLAGPAQACTVLITPMSFRPQRRDVGPFSTDADATGHSSTRRDATARDGRPTVTTITFILMQHERPRGWRARWAMPITCPDAGPRWGNLVTADAYNREVWRSTPMSTSKPSQFGRRSILTPWKLGSFLAAHQTSMAIQHDAGGERPAPKMPLVSMVRGAVLRLEAD